MAADTYDPILGIILQGTGNNNNAWGTTFNNSAATPLGRAIGGVNIIGSTGGTVDLSTTVPPAGLRQDVDAIQLMNGTLTSALTIKVPNVSKIWWFENDTSGAFNTYVQLPGGTSPNGLVQIPQGVAVMVMCDGAGHLRRLDRAKVGEFVYSGGTVVPAGTLLSDGSSLLRTDFPDLYNAIGTTWGAVDGTHFTLPKLTDTARFLRSSSGTLVPGTYQSNQNAAHTHAITGAPGVGTLSTDSQGNHSHTINVSDPTHLHVYAGPGVNSTTGGGSFQVSGPIGVVQTNSSSTGITASAATAGAHAHNVTGAPSAGTLATASQGGTEARPESAVCAISIRY